MGNKLMQNNSQLKIIDRLNTIQKKLAKSNLDKVIYNEVSMELIAVKLDIEKLETNVQQTNSGQQTAKGTF